MKPPTKEEIALQQAHPEWVAEYRYIRKIEMLRTKRDYWKDRYEEVSRVMRQFPFIKQRYENFEEDRKERARVKALDTMVPLLIRENAELKKKLEAYENSDA